MGATWEYVSRSGPIIVIVNVGGIIRNIINLVYTVMPCVVDELSDG